MSDEYKLQPAGVSNDAVPVSQLKAVPVTGALQHSVLYGVQEYVLLNPMLLHISFPELEREPVADCFAELGVPFPYLCWNLDRPIISSATADSLGIPTNLLCGVPKTQWNALQKYIRTCLWWEPASNRILFLEVQRTPIKAARFDAKVAAALKLDVIDIYHIVVVTQENLIRWNVPHDMQWPVFNRVIDNNFNARSSSVIVRGVLSGDTSSDLFEPLQTKPKVEVDIWAA